MKNVFALLAIGVFMSAVITAHAATEDWKQQLREGFR